MVFDVWDSIEELEAFTATLMPILAIEHIDMAPPEPARDPRPQRGGDSTALRRTIAELRDTAFFIRPTEKLRSNSTACRASPRRTTTLPKPPPARDDSRPSIRRPAWPSPVECSTTNVPSHSIVLN
jgi:hypothetical protein